MAVYIPVKSVSFYPDGYPHTARKELVNYWFGKEGIILREYDCGLDTGRISEILEKENFQLFDDYYKARDYITPMIIDAGQPDSLCKDGQIHYFFDIMEVETDDKGEMNLRHQNLFGVKRISWEHGKQTKNVTYDKTFKD